MEEEILQMGTVVEEMIHKAIHALVQRDEKLAESIVRMDDVADQHNLHIEQRCMRMLALQQPMARDLREIASALHIIHDIERCGDYAVDIAKSVTYLAYQPVSGYLVDIPKMAEHVQRMLREALETFVSRDLNAIEKMVHDDDEVDHLFKAFLYELAAQVRKDSNLAEAAMLVLLIARYLERIADHITNIGERIYYMETGEMKELHV